MTPRRGFVAWVRDRHAAPLHYEAMEAEVERMEAQLAELAHLVQQGIFTEEERTHANESQGRRGSPDHNYGRLADLGAQPPRGA